MAAPVAPITSDDLDDSDILAQAKTDWRRSYSHWRKWRTEAKEDFAFVSGDQWADDDKLHLDAQGRPAVVFNRVAPMVDAVAGSEVQNRQEVRYIPRELGDAAVNEAFTSAAKYFRDLCDAEDEESTAFLDCLTCGVGWTETRIDHDEDPDGTIVVERVDPFEVFADPSATRGNLSDAKYVFRVKDLTKEEVEQAWPGAIEGMLPGAFSWGDVDEDEDEPHETRHGGQYDVGGKTPPGRARRRRYRVVEYQWKEFSPVYRMIDPQTGQEATFDARRYAALQKMFKRLGGPPPPALRQKRLEVRRAFFMGDEVLENEPGPCPTAFTYKAITGKRDRNSGTWYGLVRPMKDPQRWSNKFFSQILHIINTNAKGGLLAEAGAVDDVREFESRWAEADSIMWTRDGGVAQGKIIPKPITQVPPDVSNMMAFCVQSLRDVTGINLELLGMAEQVQPGVLEYQRRQSGLMILATLFDSLRRYRKEQGRLMLYFIQEYIPEGRLIRIEGPLGAQYVPLMKQGETAQFDVVVDEAPSSPNLKEQVFGVMQVVAPQLLAMGVRIPPESLDYLPLPDSLVQAIRKANEPQEGQPPPVDPAIQAMQQQIALDQQKAQSDAAIAQQKLASETDIKQQQLQGDMAIQQQKLALEKAQVDQQMQIENMRMQLEQLKMQAMLQKVVPGATNEIEQSQTMLYETLAALHQNVQSGMGALADGLKATAGRQDEIASVLKQLSDGQGKSGSTADQIASMLKQLADGQSQHGEMLQQLAAPREVVRDAMGRVSGMRVANGKAH